MNLSVLIVIIFALLFYTEEASAASVPDRLLGLWGIQEHFDDGLSGVGIDRWQELKIMKMTIIYEKNTVLVCGKKIPIEKVNIASYDTQQFLDVMNYSPTFLRFQGDNFTDIEINPDGKNIYCDGMPAPGLSILLDDYGHVVTDVQAALFELKKVRR